MCGRYHLGAEAQEREAAQRQQRRLRQLLVRVARVLAKVLPPRRHCSRCAGAAIAATGGRAITGVEALLPRLLLQRRRPSLRSISILSF